MHSVGSVIDIQGGKFVVCGFRPYENSGAIGMGYLLVPYPLGFVSASSFTLVSSDNDYPMVYEGFCNEDAEAYDRLLEQMRAFGRETTVHEMADAADEVATELADLATKMVGEE